MSTLQSFGRKEYFYKVGDLVIGRSGIKYKAVPEIRDCTGCAQVDIPHCGKELARGTMINCGITRIIFIAYTGPLGRRFINLKEYPR